MAVNRFGNEDMSSFWQGAQIGNMMALRRERAQQLQSQAALNAVHERLLAAQADEVANRVQRQKELESDIKDTADTMDRMVHEGMNTHPFEPGQDQGPVLEMYKRQAEEWAARTHPQAALVIGKAKEAMEGRQADVERERHNRAMEGLRGQEVAGRLKGAEEVGKITAEIDPVTGKKVAVLRTSPTGATMVGAKTKAGELSPIAKAEVGAIYTRIKALQKQHDALEPEEGAVKDHPNTVKRARLRQQILQLREELKLLQPQETAAGGQAAAASKLFKFVPGKGIVPAEPDDEGAEGGVDEADENEE